VNLAEWLVSGASALLLIVPVELPDKTFVATLVLATRYRPLPVWLGVCAAFAIQCAIAATAGHVLALLPELPVRLAAAVLFAVGAVLLWRGARRADEEEAESEREYAERVGSARSGIRAFGASFLVLFAAEWGDLSQLLIAGLVASGRPAVPVAIGAWLGLATVAGLGVVLGRVILRYVRLRFVRYVGGAVCAVLATVTAFSVLV
jgi:putative Ca2+/H+ antiporter (TMEM165/GDT1 family)